jgi:hypothetical protein
MGKGIKKLFPLCPFSLVSSPKRIAIATLNHAASENSIIARL